MQQSAVALGVFDGLHKGHQEIFNILKSTSYERKIVLIFEPHPRKILNDTDVKYIMPLDVRISEIKKLGFEDVYVLTFSKEFSLIPGEKFIKDVLIKQYGCKHLVVGFNAHFGNKRDVTPDTLPLIARLTNISVTICQSEMYKNIPISSTRIREEIKKGQLYDVLQMLGKNFFIEGNLIHGVGLGKKIGFPTLNVKYREEQILPPVGVYFGYVNSKLAMINLGVRPTVETQSLHKPVLEAHIINENLDKTSNSIRIEFVEKIRDEKRFNSIEELKQQLEKDKMYIMKKYC